MNPFVIVYLVLFSTVTLPDDEKYMQVTMLHKYSDVDECHKYVERTARALNLSSEQKDDLGCIRIMKGDAKVKEA